MPPETDARAHGDLLARDDAFDLMLGVAALTESPLVAALADCLVRHPTAPLAIAFNHKQIACKSWLVRLLRAQPVERYEHVLVVGGWLGVLPALLLERMNKEVGCVTSLDIDPSCRPVAETLNAANVIEARFRALTGDMMQTDPANFAGGWPSVDLVINTSCEHLPDVRGWLARLPRGLRVVLQSNDYIREPEHVSCVPSLDAFKAQTRLSHIDFGGEFALKHYTRFMLIGRV